MKNKDSTDIPSITSGNPTDVPVQGQQQGLSTSHTFGLLGHVCFNSLELMLHPKWYAPTEVSLMEKWFILYSIAIWYKQKSPKIADDFFSALGYSTGFVTMANWCLRFDHWDGCHCHHYMVSIDTKVLTLYINGIQRTKILFFKRLWDNVTQKNTKFTNKCRKVPELNASYTKLPSNGVLFLFSLKCLQENIEKSS